MSVLDPPRLYFRGQITWDPIVSNNDAQSYDLTTSKPTFDGGTAEEYRQREIFEVVAGGNWNPHGTHRSTLFETSVSGVDLGEGLRTDDPVVGVPVDLTGMLVDLNPYAANASQLFFDAFTVGIDGGCQVGMRSEGPMVARRINFARNTGYRYIAGLASAVWQASSTTASAVIVPRGSHALEALAAAMHASPARGLTVRLNSYRTVYFDKEAPTSADVEALKARVESGGFQPNPARSLVVGVIGLWGEDEPAAEPGDRVLGQAGAGTMGTAFAKVVGSSLVLDLGNSIQETGFDCTKADLGDIEVQAATPQGAMTLGTLAPADYDRAAYEATSGITTLPLDAAGVAAAEGGAIHLRPTGGAGSTLEEQELTVVPAAPSLYLDAAGAAPSMGFRVFRLGAPVSTATTVLVTRVAAQDQPAVITTDDTGHGSVTVDDPPGSWQWVLTPFEGDAPAAPQGVDAQNDSYFITRVTPADEFIAGLEPTWPNVYQYVLSSWYALAPCMDNWLKLDDEAACTRAAARIKQHTSLDWFDSFRYMPVTRDLSSGQRQLLHRWCDLVTGDAEPAAERLALAEATQAPLEERLRKRSRGL